MINEQVCNKICHSCGHVFNESGARNKIQEFYRESYKLMDSSSEAEFKYYSGGKSFTYSDWRLNCLLERVKLPNNGNVLDIGCGKGNFLLQFSYKNPKWHLHGIEVSQNALNFAKEKLSKAEFKEGVFNKKSYDKEFDLITSLGVVEHLENPNLFFQAVTSCLKEDGILFLDVPNFKLNPADLFVYDHLNHFTIETLENLLNINNLKIIKVIESSEKVPLFVICKKTSKNKEIKNHFLFLKNIITEHIKFNNLVFGTFREVNNKNKELGIFGLGIIALVGIQHGFIDKEKIIGFFDENNLLVGKERFGIEIRSLEEIKNFQNIPIIFSVSPCYFNDIIPKLKNIKANYLLPNGYNYHKKFFS